MAHTLKAESAANIRKGTSLPHTTLLSPNLQDKAIDSATSEPKTKIPGFVCVSVNKSGDEIFSHASGLRGAESKEKMDLDSVFWIASCTKMVGGIACLQLVEQGKLSLDDGDQAEKL